MYPILIGSVGVGLLLVAFALNLLKKLSESSRIYLGLNVLGALLAAWYAYDGRAIPFLILEFVWGATALVRLILVTKKGSPA